MRFLADIALFVEVANTGNFGRAAAALGMPASTLSRRISALEQKLGCKLIHRSSRRFSLTDAGKTCYEESKALVAEAKRIQEGITGSASQSSGHIRVGVPLDLAQTLFLPLFAQHMIENPGTSIEVLSTHGHPNLLAESLDIAIWVGHQLRLPDSSFSSRRVGTFARRLFASRDYVRGHKKLQEPQQLTEHACLRLVHGEPLSKWELRRGREFKTVTVNGPATANSVGMLARFAKEGMGIAVLPDFLAAHPGFGDGLVRVLCDWEAMPAHLFAVTPSDLQPARVRKLISSMKQKVEGALK